MFTSQMLAITKAAHIPEQCSGMPDVNPQSPFNVYKHRNNTKLNLFLPNFEHVGICPIFYKSKSFQVGKSLRNTGLFRTR